LGHKKKRNRLHPRPKEKKKRKLEKDRGGSSKRIPSEDNKPTLILGKKNERWGHDMEGGYGKKRGRKWGSKREKLRNE